VSSIGRDLVLGSEPPEGVREKYAKARKQLYPCFSRTCQLRCDYCIANMRKPGAQNRPSLLAEIGVSAYIAKLQPILDRYRPLEVFLGGPGEPLITPDFGKFCEAFLDDGHRVHVTTNGIACNALRRFVEARGPGRLTCDVTYHRGPLARRGRDFVSRVRENAERLAELGILRNLVVPMDPRACQDVAELAEELLDIQRLGKRVRVKVRRLSHTDGERRYPESYTAKELAAIQDLLDRVDGAEMWPAGEPRLLAHLSPPLNLCAAPCFAPTRVLNIGLDGGLWNCFAQPFRPRAQGHLASGYDVERVYADGATGCGYLECSCRILGIEYCLEAHGSSLEEYCAAYHSRAGNDAAVRAIMNR
jgi:MoaA/NifB/PqqE/SkfB family radical SAM enzyme